AACPDEDRSPLPGGRATAAHLRVDLAQPKCPPALRGPAGRLEKRRGAAQALCPVDAASPGPTGRNLGPTADPRVELNALRLDSGLDSSIIAAPADRN